MVGLKMAAIENGKALGYNWVDNVIFKLISVLYLEMQECESKLAFHLPSQD
jgi:hypothetical protein